MTRRRTSLARWSTLALAVLTACTSATDETSVDTAGETVVAATAATTVTAATTPATVAATVASTSSSTTVPATSTSAVVTSGRAPAQPDGVPWPTSEWATAELPAGVDAAAIDEAVAVGFGDDLATARVRAVVVVHGGAIVYERYHPLDSPDAPTPSFSVAKSVTATLAGMLADEGLIDVDAPAPVPEWQEPGDPRAGITIDQLLRMSSGLAWQEQYGPGTLPYQLARAEHAADVPIAQPLAAEPGTVWNYSSGTSAIITDILADALGGPDELDRFIRDRLMAPLGITSTTIQTDASGTFYGGFGFDSTPRDYARFGLLHLRGGVWDGERILSEAWIDYTREPSATNAQYGAHWWLFGRPGSFSAQGLFGQQIVIDPQLDLVVVTTATAGGDAHRVSAAIVDEFARVLAG